MILLGVDVGQVGDPSALVAVGQRHGRVVVLGAEERPRGEEYAALVAAVDERCRVVEGHGHRVIPVVDATGVGRPIVEQLRTLRDTLGITITGGRRATGAWPDWRVPKPLLVHMAVTGVEAGQVATPHWERFPVLHEQVRALRHKPTGRIEAAGAGHDDLALAWMYAVYASRLLDRPELQHRLEVRSGTVVAT